MDSINKQQEEENIKNLAGDEAIKKVKELVEIAEACFFCTDLNKVGVPLSIRPMSVQKVDDEGNLWFLSAKDSHKNEELSNDPFVHLLFQGSRYSDFLNIYGLASVSDDKKKIDELWVPILKTWFTEGKDDPRITVIKVEPTEAYYWDNKHGNAIAFAKQSIGSIFGKTIDDSVEGKLDL
ncbi:pyridoxamine 5'-phosphate oxidase family protein [Olivibacter domesticus]|uniref:General stress protein 26 n=1 Tax=Olivibacter domesticus TaxID=407022 RepID=A0A1H7JDB5_OLID1|nr:pyridoxamine 5'-phosphate oxidase family protein [Olivibacter domesticus]SEK72631.1 General stress protein 26 [Olivibacter domesticus]